MRKTEIIGSQIQTISARSTARPVRLKNLEIFIGEAYRGLQGTKYRVLSKGMKNPTPMLKAYVNPIETREQRPLCGNEHALCRMHLRHARVTPAFVPA
jgi:hypothetical protein